MGDAREDFGQAADIIKQGLLRAGAPSSSSSIVGGAAGGSAYYGTDRSEAEGMIREGLKAAGLPPIRTGLLDNTDADAKAIGDKLVRDSEARIAEQRPHEAPTEPTQSAMDMIKAGLGAERARAAKAEQARADAVPKVRRSWK